MAAVDHRANLLRRLVDRAGRELELGGGDQRGGEPAPVPYGLRDGADCAIRGRAAEKSCTK